MTLSEIKPGDRVDYRELRNGEVVRVGRATVWVTFTLPKGGAFPVSAHPAELRPHVERCRLQVGEYVISDVSDGKIWLHSNLSGESMQTDIAKLESCLARFWRKEF